MILSKQVLRVHALARQAVIGVVKRQGPARAPRAEGSKSQAYMTRID